MHSPNFSWSSIGFLFGQAAVKFNLNKHYSKEKTFSCSHQKVWKLKSFFSKSEPFDLANWIIFPSCGPKGQQKAFEIASCNFHHDWQGGQQSF